MGNYCWSNRYVDPPLIDPHPEPEDVLQVRFLLLGAGESGKTTLFKQMQLQYIKDFASENMMEQRQRIRNAFFNSFGDLVTAIKMQHSTLGDADMDEMADFIFPGDANGNRKLTNPAVRLIRDIWASDKAKQIWDQRSNFQITDSLGYFCSQLDRVAADDYVPTEEDFLKCRIQTLGISEQTFTYNGVQLLVTDVGGQRAERKKWLQCLVGVTGVFFVVAVSEFNQKLFEDVNVDRLNESRSLFQKTLKFALLEKTPFVVFFNKMDLLEEKLERAARNGDDLDEYFPDLKLGTDFTNAKAKVSEHIKDTFWALDEVKSREKHLMYYHFTTATDKKSFDAAFNAATSVILGNILDKKYRKSARDV